jgi:hypothetical protein
MSDHRHEAYDIYGTAATSGDVGHLERAVQSAVQSLREDLSAAQERIRQLENDVTALHGLASGRRS